MLSDVIDENLLKVDDRKKNSCYLERYISLQINNYELPVLIQTESPEKHVAPAS